ncbi:type II toxin-antitoxin system HigB family toxin [Rhizobium sp. 2YAF20]|uniref:type II toxin-antitoxin system HigB family toxin n=1 Tax=Rhizobium sp. 2YAF20 TaxID=3233027 RepID=UPI003F949CAD
MFGSNVDFLGDHRAIFDIAGNRHRPIVYVAYSLKRVLIKFVSKHAPSLPRIRSGSWLCRRASRVRRIRSCRYSEIYGRIVKRCELPRATSSRTRRRSPPGRRRR